MEIIRKKCNLIGFILCLLLCTCSDNIYNKLDSVELHSMIDDYYYYYGEYPNSAKCLLEYFNDMDSINVTTNYLNKQKNNISWTLNNPSVLDEELLIKEKQDTILWICGKKHLSFFDNLINSYERVYLDYPSSLDDLICYDKTTRGIKEDVFDRCIPLTLNYLERNKEQLTWQKNDTLLLILTGNDTVSCRIGPSLGISICQTKLGRCNRLSLFFDIQGKTVISEDLTKAFKSGIQEICQQSKDEFFESLEFHILQYQVNEGLTDFCKDDTAVLKSPWFIEVHGFLEQFAPEHGLGRIVFAFPCIK